MSVGFLVLFIHFCLCVCVRVFWSVLYVAQADLKLRVLVVQIPEC